MYSKILNCALLNTSALASSLEQSDSVDIDSALASSLEQSKSVDIDAYETKVSKCKTYISFEFYCNRVYL